MDISKGPDEAVLIGSRCLGCGKYFFPPREVCPFCFNRQLERVTLSRTGKIYSYFISWAPPAGFEPPYVAGLVDLPEGVRLYSQLTGCQPDGGDLELGMEVELALGTLGTDPDGSQVVVYTFRPRREAACGK